MRKLEIIEARPGVEIGNDFALIPLMVARRGHRRAGAQQVDADFRRDPPPRWGNFAVKDKIEGTFLFEMREGLNDRAASRFANDITEEEESEHAERVAAHCAESTRNLLNHAASGALSTSRTFCATAAMV